MGYAETTRRSPPPARPSPLPYPNNTKVKAGLPTGWRPPRNWKGMRLTDIKRDAEMKKLCIHRHHPPEVSWCVHLLLAGLRQLKTGVDPQSDERRRAADAAAAHRFSPRPPPGRLVLGARLGASPAATFSTPCSTTAATQKLSSDEAQGLDRVPLAADGIAGTSSNK